MIKKITLISITVLALMGCGGSDSSEAVSTKVTDIAGLEGFWNTSYDKDGKHDELYEFFFANGDIGIFDYQGDTFDNGAECYLIVRSPFEIRQNVAGVFYFYDLKEEKEGLKFDAEISTDALTIIDAFEPNKKLVYPKVTKTLAEIEAKRCPSTNKAVFQKIR